MGDVAAHEQRETVRILWHYPEHAPRPDMDGHDAFVRTRARLVDSPELWHCHVPRCRRTDLELHHGLIEVSLMNGVALEKFNELYGLHLSPTEFADYINGPEGTTLYCSFHHRGAEGIHVLPEPGFRAVEVWRDDLEPPAAKEAA